MNKILLIFLLIAGFSSALSLSIRLPSIKVDPIKLLCDAATGNPTVATGILDNLKKVFAAGTVTQRFPLSVAYINEQSSQLFAGRDSCRSFFNGLVIQFRTDLQNNKQNTQNVEQQLMQLIQNKFPQFTSLLG